jgi:molybdate transport system permease protein
MFPLSPLTISLWVAAWACLIALVGGTLVAWLLVRGQFRGKWLAEALAMSPMILPPTVLGYYLLVLLGQQGIGPWVEQVFGFRFVFTLNGAILASSITAFPLVLQSVRAGLLAINPEIENSARIDGCGEWGLLWRISLPLAWPSMFAGGVLGFLRALGDFGTVLMVAGNIPGRTQTMAMAIYDAVQRNDTASANQLTLTLTAIAFGLLFVALRVSHRALDVYRM